MFSSTIASKIAGLFADFACFEAEIKWASRYMTTEQFEFLLEIFAIELIEEYDPKEWSRLDKQIVARILDRCRKQITRERNHVSLIAGSGPVYKVDQAEELDQRELVEEVRGFLWARWSILNEVERQFLIWKMRGKSDDTIRAELGLSRRQFDQFKRDVYDKFRSNWFHTDLG